MVLIKYFRNCLPEQVGRLERVKGHGCVGCLTLYVKTPKRARCCSYNCKWEGHGYVEMTSMTVVIRRHHFTEIKQLYTLKWFSLYLLQKPRLFK
jgi:hypothetical protein